MADDLRPVYDKLDALQAQLSQLSGEMRANTATINATLGERCANRGERIEAIEERQDSHAKRLSKLETSGAHGKGYLAGIVAAGGTAGAIVSLAFKLLSAGK